MPDDRVFACVSGHVTDLDVPLNVVRIVEEADVFPCAHIAVLAIPDVRPFDAVDRDIAEHDDIRFSVRVHVIRPDDLPFRRFGKSLSLPGVGAVHPEPDLMIDLVLEHYIADSVAVDVA